MAQLPGDICAANAASELPDGGGALLTFTETAALVPVCPLELLATAVRVWLPFDSAVVSSEYVNGALVTGLPMLLPSTLNCTLTVLAETLVKTVRVPETVTPEAGEVIEIVGGVGVALLTFTETVALVVV